MQLGELLQFTGNLFSFRICEMKNFIFLFVVFCMSPKFAWYSAFVSHSLFVFLFFRYIHPPEQSFEKFPSITEQTVWNNYWSRCVTSSAKRLFHSLRLISLWLSEPFCFFVLYGRSKGTRTFSESWMHPIFSHPLFCF
jgi:hypothetical protein